MEITRLVPKEKKGLVVVITGNGKGKTTSALGIVVRACGHNMRVCIIQFMKGDLYAGEWDGVKKMNCQIELISTGKGFCGIQGNPYPYEEHRKNAQDAIELARKKIGSGKFDIVILDEVNNALKLKLVDREQVLDLLRQEPPLIHLVLTGRANWVDNSNIGICNLFVVCDLRFVIFLLLVGSGSSKLRIIKTQGFCRRPNSLYISIISGEQASGFLCL